MHIMNLKKNTTSKEENLIQSYLENILEKASDYKKGNMKYKLVIDNMNYAWSNNGEKISIIRAGLPYTAIESISKLTNIPVRHYLNSLEIVQTTYNKNKKNKKFLSKKSTEFIVEIIELYEFGLLAFNNEAEKFQRWLRKSNISLGGTIPESLFDSLTGINEIKKVLNRIEYGNMV